MSITRKRGERILGLMESSVVTRKVAPRTLSGGKRRAALETHQGSPQPVRKEQRGKGGRKRASLPTTLRGHIFPSPVLQNLCTLLLLS